MDTWPGQLTTLFFLRFYTAWPAYFDTLDVWPDGLASILECFHCVAKWPGQLTTLFFLRGYMAWSAYFDIFDVWPHGLASTVGHFFDGHLGGFLV